MRLLHTIQTIFFLLIACSCVLFGLLPVVRFREESETLTNESMSANFVHPKPHYSTILNDASKSVPKNKTESSNQNKNKFRCFVFWFGPRMHGQRGEAFKNLKGQIESDGLVSVNLITDENLLDYEIRDSPYHPAALLRPGLSGNHLSDYFRAYFMHHYGGCYHDVKFLPRPPNLAPLFEKLFSNSSIWLLGAPERHMYHVDCDDNYAAELNVTCINLHLHYRSLMSNGMYMANRRTEFTKTWLSLVERRLTEKFESLKQNPSPTGRCCVREAEKKGYPFDWTELHAKLFHPLQRRYSAHVVSGFPWFSEKNYRGETEDK